MEFLVIGNPYVLSGVRVRRVPIVKRRSLGTRLADGYCYRRGHRGQIHTGLDIVVPII